MSTFNSFISAFGVIASLLSFSIAHAGAPSAAVDRTHSDSSAVSSAIDDPLLQMAIDFRTGISSYVELGKFPVFVTGGSASESIQVNFTDSGYHSELNLVFREVTFTEGDREIAVQIKRTDFLDQVALGKSRVQTVLVKPGKDFSVLVKGRFEGQMRHYRLRFLFP